MPTYAFQCQECGANVDVWSRMELTPSPPTHCGVKMRRRFHAPAIVRAGVGTHYNHSLGKVVSGEREFRSELARKSDEMSERTGIEQHYAPLAPGEAPGVDTDHVKEWARKKELSW